MSNRSCTVLERFIEHVRRDHHSQARVLVSAARTELQAMMQFDHEPHTWDRYWNYIDRIESGEIVNARPKERNTYKQYRELAENYRDKCKVMESKVNDLKEDHNTEINDQRYRHLKDIQKLKEDHVQEMNRKDVEMNRKDAEMNRKDAEMNRKDAEMNRKDVEINYQKNELERARKDHRVKIDKMDKESALMCTICESKPKNRAFYPCGHAVCNDCAVKLNKKCPFCKTEYEEVRPLYL